MTVDLEDITAEAILAGALAKAPNSPLLRHPLLRKIYLIFFLLTTILVLVPLWSIKYLPRRNRPKKSWTIKRCLRVRFSRRLCGLVARCELDYLGRDLSEQMDPLKLSHSHPVTVEPAPFQYLRGHPAETLAHLHKSRGKWHPVWIHRQDPHRPGVWGTWNEAKEEYGFATVQAFWYTGEKKSPHDGDPVMLHFHGGGYLCGTAAETDLTSSIPKSLVKHSPIHHVLSVDYRLAPTAPWPLPLLDAISAYHHLVHAEKIPESDIVLAGDSAGGHLAMALARYLRDEGAHLGLSGPAGLVLMSPWSDLGFTNAWGDGMYHNADCDTIDDTFGPFASSLLLRAMPVQLMHTSSYLSPAGYLIQSKATGPDSFEGFPPTLIIAGGAERLSKSIAHLWSRFELARDLSPCQDRYIECPDAVHDFMIFPWMSEEAAKMYEEIDHWLRELLLQAASKSPVLRPRRDRTISMVGDMQHESFSLLDIPPLDLNDTAYRLMTPFTAQFERGEWDWEGEDWYDMEASESEDEPKKDR